MSKNPKCPKCNGRTVCVGFGTRMEIEYKCQTTGCRARVIQDTNGVQAR